MNREKAVKIVMSMLEKNVEDLEMSEDKMGKTLVDLGVDSLDLMLVIMDVGEAAGVAISDDEAEVLDTPEKIVEFIIK
ncbi:acyl carrier protein [Marinobacter sp. M3C]|jgi:acyl carrier protein|uniref:phosphopantetheine-binding protein n=1 Tax=unclassified Marinobacter TaxID=83889 RepID=UPI00200DF8F3|nr:MULTISPECIES: acyl carrier protein [unclassified Marinobacter]MCL1479077.1 acyl carrier protein [Marinobacter sp.]MCL1485122.1 acyl carrier protein [Marinobacter sp.]MCL1488953.1 acyl carrier protein [Marinobacter sp.]UQG57155.1 acyl carrier protein [Marinobacter sp. M4C]UQG61663.1 acyl carrier protein [Marinobacter sp. M3C]